VNTNFLSLFVRLDEGTEPSVSTDYGTNALCSNMSDLAGATFKLQTSPRADKTKIGFVYKIFTRKSFGFFLNMGGRFSKKDHLMRGLRPSPLPQSATGPRYSGIAASGGGTWG